MLQRGVGRGGIDAVVDVCLQGSDGFGIIDDLRIEVEGAADVGLFGRRDDIDPRITLVALGGASVCAVCIFAGDRVACAVGMAAAVGGNCGDGIGSVLSGDLKVRGETEGVTLRNTVGNAGDELAANVEVLREFCEEGV
jgi:hypothetical protein